MRFEFELNGRPVAAEGPAARSALDLLREQFGLTAAKPGCRNGRCGACTIQLDGRPVNACLVLSARLDGRRVTTAEGLHDDPLAARIREVFAAEGALQCGYCTPGLTVALHAALARPEIEPSAATVTGHLCRCTGYAGLRRALDRFRRKPAGPDQQSG